MTLDWWGLGLQAVNVLILVWLLSRVFWRPVAGAIARRQEAAQVMLDEGQRVQAKAEAALAEVAEVRAGIAAERDTILAEAKAAADTIAKAALRTRKPRQIHCWLPRALTLTAKETRRGKRTRRAPRNCRSKLPRTAPRPVQHSLRFRPRSLRDWSRPSRACPPPTAWR
jgi:hypothetical protein